MNRDKLAFYLKDDESLDENSSLAKAYLAPSSEHKAVSVMCPINTIKSITKSDIKKFNCPYTQKQSSTSKLSTLDSCVKDWKQCGGEGYSGPTTCCGYSKCIVKNAAYSQCSPSEPPPDAPCSYYNCEQSYSYKEYANPWDTINNYDTACQKNDIVSLPDEEVKNVSTDFFVGANIQGFSLGSNIAGDYNNYTIKFAIQSNMNIIRMPFKPAIMFTVTGINTLSFNDVWDTGCSKMSNWGTGSYIKQVEYALEKGLTVIIDAHDADNNNSLQSVYKSNKVSLTDKLFIAMWNMIANYFNKNLSKHVNNNKVWLELYNEPMNAPDTTIDYKSYNEKYQLLAYNTIYGINRNFKVLVTTYGNWSGIHDWYCNHDNLQDLVNTFNKKDNVIIAGHQYCDPDYSGQTSDCKEEKFNQNYFCNWINNLETIIKPSGLKWFLSEGGVTCDKTSSNCNLYYDWLMYITQNSPSCLGFTTWVMEPVVSNNPKNMIFGPYSAWVNAYSNNEPYPKNGQNLYDFSKFKRTISVPIESSCTSSIPKSECQSPGPPGNLCTSKLSSACGAQIVQKPNDPKCFYDNGIIKPECANKCQIVAQNDPQTFKTDKCFSHPKF